MAACAACVMFTVSASAIQTRLLTFDDITEDFDAAVPNGYGGLNWVNFHAVDGLDYLSSGYSNAVVSPDFVAYSFGTNQVLKASIKARPGKFFRVNSGYFTAAWNDDLQLEIVGKQNNRTVYRKTYSLSTSEPTFIKFPKTPVTSINFTSSGGTYNTNLITGSGVHFAVDNLSVTTQ